MSLHLLFFFVGAAPGYEGVPLLCRLILQLGMRNLDAVVFVLAFVEVVAVDTVVFVDAVFGDGRQRPLSDFRHLFVKVLNPDARW